MLTSSSGMGSRRQGLAEAVVAIVLDQALDHLLGEEQPLAAAAGAPLGQLLADLVQRHRRVGISQKDTKNCLERRHIAMDVVLGSAAMLTNAFERVAAVRRMTDLEAHPAGCFVENGRALFDFLADFGSAGVT